MNEGVVSWKGADLTVARYIGRCAIGTTVDDVRATLTSSNVDVISLEAVQTKHNRFASFKFVGKKSQLDIIENEDLWPAGVMVGRWWDPKPPDTESDALS